MKRRVRFGIKAKFVIVAAAIVGVSSLATGSWFVRTEEKLLFEKLVSDGRLLVTSMKSPVLTALIEADEKTSMGNSRLDGIMEEMVNNVECKAAYAYVVNTQGKVIAHNRLAEFGKIYTDPLLLAAVSEGVLQHRMVGHRDRGDAVLEMVMPLSIYEKKWGALCVGLSLLPMQQQEIVLKKTIGYFSLMLFLCGTAIFYLVGLTLTRPIKEMSAVMADVSSETLDAAVFPVMRRDEIGQLQRSLVAMLERLKQSENERQRVVQSLIQSEKLASIGRLVTGVAHEINNPLTAMESCIYNLRHSATENVTGDLEILEQGCARIETIVRQLADFSRAGTLFVEQVASDRFFAEMVAFARLALQPRSLELKVEDHCSPPVMLTMDRGKLHQVALDLLINAADASPPFALVKVSAYLQEQNYCLSVKDQGIGIPEHLQEKIFEPFFTGKPAGKGSGIGLAICKTIIDMHRGTIMVKSKPGETEFTVKIPIDVEADHGRNQGTFG